MSKNTNLSFLTDYITADITNGRIGINNASPTYAFDVTGIARTSTSTYLATASGSVGIGTTTPTDFLDATSGLAIIAPSGRSGLSLGSTQGTADEILSRLSFTNTNSTNAGGKRLSYISGIRGTTNNSAYLEFGTANDGLGTQRMVISQTGNVGIGTSSPSDKLQVGLDENAYISIANGGSTDVKSGLRFRVGGGGTVYSAMESAASSSGNGYLSFSTIGSGTLSERMRITSSGKVLIGTTTEAAEANLSLGANNTVEGGQILLQKGTSYTYASHLDNFGDTFRLLYGTNTGTSSVNFQVFHPSGNYSFSGSNVSDKRLKENINNLKISAIEKVNQLVSKTYNMISNPETLRYGFIAQEVQEILPDLITGTESENDVLGLDYNGVLAVAVKAIQELSKEINLLKQK